MYPRTIKKIQFLLTFVMSVRSNRFTLTTANSKREKWPEKLDTWSCLPFPDYRKRGA